MESNVYMLLLEQSLIDYVNPKKINKILFYVTRNLLKNKEYQLVVNAVSLIRKKNIKIDNDGLITIIIWLTEVKESIKANSLISDNINSLDFKQKLATTKSLPEFWYKTEGKNPHERTLEQLHGQFWLEDLLSIQCSEYC
jgi:hypothetical protein